MRSVTWVILMIYYKVVVKELFQRVIPKNSFANLCEPIHNVITISVSTDAMNLETVERKDKKWNILRTKRAF